MADNRKLYKVTLQGGVEAEFLLDQEDADRYGDAATVVSTKEAAAPANKARG